MAVGTRREGHSHPVVAPLLTHASLTPIPKHPTTHTPNPKTQLAALTGGSMGSAFLVLPPPYFFFVVTLQPGVE